jgi:pimeloyl-ACP methyl ester carboxylesterase
MQKSPDTLSSWDGLRMWTAVRGADGARISYLACGQGVPVLAVHGIGSTARSFEPVATHLSSTHRVLTLDLHGYGDSDDRTSAGGWTAFAEDVSAVLDDAVEHDAVNARAHVVAASAGTLTALAYCHAHPQRVRSLTLLGPTLGDAADQELARTRLAERRRALTDVREGAGRRAARMAGPDADEVALALLRSEHARIRAAGYGVVAELLAQTDAAPQLSTLSVPLQVLVGDHDIVTGPPVAAQIQQRVPSAKVVVLPRVGHSPHVERPDETAGLVRAFADAIER